MAELETMLVTIRRIIDATGASVIVDADDNERMISNVVWDSREVVPGALYIALPGERVDGNDFIIPAIDNGAAAIIATRPVTKEECERVVAGKVTLLRATDGVKALQDVARDYRSSLTAKVVAVTGSSGKTSTKELIKTVLATAFETVFSVGNRNNELGLPGTVLSANPGTEVLITEMGMRGHGQIRELADIAQPDIGIVTNIGHAHLELLGSRSEIARAKGELIEALKDGRGIAVLNGDDPYSSLIRQAADTAARDIRVVSFGLGKQNDIRADHIVYDDLGRPSFDLWTGSAEPLRVKLQLQGEHSVYNALAATATALMLGMTPNRIARALAQAESQPMRQNTITLQSGAVVVDDSYNANPDSMRAALEMLARMESTRPHIAVLGDMGELGPESDYLHEQIGAMVYDTGVNQLITVGESAKFYAAGARSAGMDDARISCFEDTARATRALVALEAKKPIILIKASRFMGLEQITRALVSGEPPAVESDGGR
ncbi:MAG TPA: UDP-N-acetylmuramoyl-tripeptide--D-alanyl-D-alanine ligase [Coriobacteriia bacterium]|nr:UDP-N-acetylmuramoyl-tripeptide--D-alanyl-D-alanine ligase [Coriobacteriia bacterium]